MQTQRVGRWIATALLSGGCLFACATTAFAQAVVVVAETTQAAAQEPGVLIVAVEADSPAAAAAIRRGDIVLAVGEKPVNTAAELAAAVRAAEPGDNLALTVQHGDEQRQVEVTLAERAGGPFLGVQPLALPDRSTMARPSFGQMPGLPPMMPGPGAMPGLGATVTLSATAGIPLGEVLPESPAAEAGLQAGDLIIAIDGEAVQPNQDPTALIAAHKPGDQLVLKIQRGGAAGEVESFEQTVTLAGRPDDASKPYLGVKVAPAMVWAQTITGPGVEQAPREAQRFFFRREGPPFGGAPMAPNAPAPYMMPMPPMPPAVPYDYGYGAPWLGPLPFAMPFIVVPLPQYMPYWSAPAMPPAQSDQLFTRPVPSVQPDILYFQAAPFNGFAPAVPFALPQEDFEIQVMI